VLHLARLLILIVFVFTSRSNAAAQECKAGMNGVIEDENGEPMVGATVWIEALKSGTTTDLNGAFTFSNLCPGTYTLLIRFVGYEDQTVSTRIPVSKTQIVQMKPSVEILHDLVIEGDHIQRHSLSQSLSILSEDQLLVNKGKTLGEMLQEVPGVTNIMTGPSVFKPVINGLHSQRLLILNNGIRQEGQQWGIDHAPEIDTYIASELEVIKGAEAVRYGSDAMGGAILINPSPLHYSEGVGGEVNLAFASNNRMGAFSGMLEGGLAKHTGLAWRVQGTLKKGGDFHAPDYNLSNTGAEEHNFSTSLGYRRDKNQAEVYFSSFNTTIGILRSSHTGNLDDLQNSIVNNRPWYIDDFTYDVAPPKQQIAHQLVKARFKRNFTTATALTILYGGQFNHREEYDVRRDKKEIPALSLDLFANTIDATLDFGKGYWFGSGGISLSAKANSNLTGNGLLPNYDQQSGALFLIERYKKEKWLVELGARIDRQLLKPKMYEKEILLTPEYNFTYSALSAGGSLFINTTTRLSSNVGLTTRTPQVNELFSQGLHHGSAAIEEGLLITPDGINTLSSAINLEHSYKWTSTLQMQRKSFSGEITGYLNYFDNYVYLTPYETRLTVRGFFPVFQYRQTNAFLAGSDFSIEVPLTKAVNYSLKASYVYAADQLNSNNRLTFIPPASITNTFKYTISALGKWKDLTMTIKGDYVLRQTRAPETIYPADIPSTPVGTNFDFMDAPDSYFLVRIDLAATLPLGNRELTFALTGENLMNNSYRNYMNRLRYYADETGINILARINYKFHSHH
jgi:iron complex outermembrane recepter protein